MVRVCQHPSGDNMKYNYTEGFDNAWVNTMNEFVSNLAKISKIGKGGIGLSGLDASYLFPPSALVKV